jgi:hypothetical protein
MNANSQGQRRSHFRLQYPATDRPTVQIDGVGNEVLEISEAGARMVLSPGPAMVAGQPFAGVLRFRDGTEVAIEGKVTRVDGDQGVLKLSPGISLNRMLTEQRQLLQRHLQTRSEPESKSE